MTRFAKQFRYGGRAVRLPHGFRFEGDEVRISHGWEKLCPSHIQRVALDAPAVLLQNGGKMELLNMAVLNVKNLPDALYKKLKARAKREHRSVAQQVTVLLTAALEEAKPLSILELKGLGKEQWRGIDAAEHVKRERSSWD